MVENDSSVLVPPFNDFSSATTASTETDEVSKIDALSHNKIVGSGGGSMIHSLDFILDIPLKVTVELGRTRLPIQDVLQLSQGSVIELSKFAGDPVEILVNDKLIARGEVVVVNEKFGVRLTDIISPVERVEQIK